MPVVRLGNHAALHEGKILGGNRVTTIPIYDEDDLPTRMRTITHADGLWPAVSAAPAVWVECDDAELGLALAAHFTCPIGEPDGWM